MRVFILRINKSNNEFYTNYSVWGTKSAALSFFKKSFEENVGRFLSTTLNSAAKALLEDNKIEECINLLNLYTKDNTKVLDNECVVSPYISTQGTYVMPNTSGSNIYYNGYNWQSVTGPNTLTLSAPTNLSYDQYKFNISIIESELKGNIFDNEE